MSAPRASLWLVIALGCAACNGERRLLTSATASGDDPSPSRTQGDAPDPAADPSAPDSAESLPPVAERVARALLARRFRDAGFRIRYDMLVQGADGFAFTADGLDPQAGVGFEYVDPTERDTDLEPAERVSLDRDGAYRILVLDPASAPVIEERADHFLAAILAQRPSP